MSEMHEVLASNLIAMASNLAISQVFARYLVGLVPFDAQPILHGPALSNRFLVNVAPSSF